jgi:hypothetical protein
LTLCTLFCNDPLLNEPGVTKSNLDINNYNKIIEFSNINIAVCDIVLKNNNVFLPFFENFYPFVKEQFIKNYDKLLDFCEKKNNEFNMENKNFKTSFYNMSVDINYNKIIQKLQESKEFVKEFVK